MLVIATREYSTLNIVVRMSLEICHPVPSFWQNIQVYPKRSII
jgi:hypothetical protein